GAHTINLVGSLPVLEFPNVGIQGPGADLLNISGGGHGYIFSVDGQTTVAISGMTLSDGRSFIGGAIINSGTLTIKNCVIRDNTAFDSGGGIFSTDTLILQNTVVRNNVAGDGGGIFSDGLLTVTASTLSGNSAIAPNGFGGYGGGINALGTVILDRSTLSGNHARDAGGGVSM